MEHSVKPTDVTTPATEVATGATSSVARSGDAKTIQDANAVLSGSSTKGWLARILPFIGPAFIACIAYVDPGNFATNIAALSAGLDRRLLLQF